MARGRRWTDEENQLIAQLYAGGASVEEIAGKLPQDRTVPAVVKQITRLGLGRGGLLSGHSKKSIVRTIEGGEVMSREEALKVLAGTIRLLQGGGEIDDVELTRLRTIISAVRSYFSVFDSFESDEYHVRTAKTIKEDEELIEAGFEYVTDRDGFKIYRKRK